METGSNKSLYTLIAVVVFGILLSLSYYLFQDSFKGILADVMVRTSQSTSKKVDLADGVIIEDIKLNSLLCTALSLPIGSVLTQEQLATVTSVSIDGSILDVKSLEGLQYLPNLTTITIQKSPITDISPLSDLTKLTTIRFYQTNISDLTPLINSPNITNIALGSNKVTSLEPLRNMTKLYFLKAYNNPFTTIEPISNLKTLTYLDLNVTSVQDVQLAANLVNLTHFEMSGLPVTNIEFLKNLTKLDYLWISGDYAVTDYTPIASLTGLKTLIMYSNNWNDLSIINGMNSLTYLDIRNTKITDLTAASSKPLTTFLHN